MTNLITLFKIIIKCNLSILWNLNIFPSCLKLINCLLLLPANNLECLLKGNRLFFLLLNLLLVILFSLKHLFIFLLLFNFIIWFCVLFFWIEYATLWFVSGFLLSFAFLWAIILLCFYVNLLADTIPNLHKLFRCFLLFFQQ